MLPGDQRKAVARFRTWSKIENCFGKKPRFLPLKHIEHLGVDKDVELLRITPFQMDRFEKNQITVQMQNQQPRSKIKTMRLSTDLIKKVEKMAEEQNRNFTNMVETILLKAVSE